jgi:hypothetical protein
MHVFCFKCCHEQRHPKRGLPLKVMNTTEDGYFFTIEDITPINAEWLSWTDSVIHWRACRVKKEEQPTIVTVEG